VVEGRWIHVCIEFSGVERGVVEAANGEGNGVGGCRPEDVSSPHKVLGKGHMGVDVEVESSSHAFAARDPASPSASVPSGVVIVGAVVVVRHFVVGREGLCRRVSLIYLWVCNVIRFVSTFFVRFVCIVFVVMCGPMVHRIGRKWFAGEGPLVFREAFFTLLIVMSVGVTAVFDGTCLLLAVVFAFNCNFG
jgi:hypothetical protein